MAIWDDLFTGGGGGILPPAIVDDKNMSRETERLSLLDSSTTDFLKLPISVTGTITRNTIEDGVVWSVAHTDVNAAADEWNGLLWLDSIGKKLFVIATDVTTSPDTHYLASILLSNGAITNIGDFQSDNFSLSSPNDMGTERGAEDSGNFFCTIDGHRFEINSTTGALIGDTTPVVDGVTSNGTETFGILSPSSTYYLQKLAAIDPNLTIVNIDRVGIGAAFVRTEVVLSGTFAASGTLAKIAFWGPNVALITHTAGSSQIHGPRMFDKTDFFRFIDESLGIT